MNKILRGMKKRSTYTDSFDMDADEETISLEEE